MDSQGARSWPEAAKARRDSAQCSSVYLRKGGGGKKSWRTTPDIASLHCGTFDQHLEENGYGEKLRKQEKQKEQEKQEQEGHGEWAYL